MVALLVNWGLFECVSAYSTVGLTMGITPDLSAASKIIIALSMFTGRIGLFVILLAIFKNIKTPGYRYPGEHILIN